MKLRLFLGLAFLCCLFIASSAMAQLSIGGTPVSFGKTITSDIPAAVMAAIDVPALLIEDEKEAKEGVPYRFGFPFEVDYNLNNSGIWEKLDDGGNLWRFRIECPGAYSINLIYDNFWLPEGARFYIYNEDRSMVIGAFTSQNNKEHGQFATAPVKGDVSILELYVPADISYPGEISILRVVHAYKDVFFNLKNEKGFGDAGSCNNNVRCQEYAQWDDQIRAVAMITTSGGWRLCTGVMVNNVRQDLAPYFLTANHCLGGEQTWVFMFNYESPSCANIDGPTWMTVSGSQLKASNSYSDFGLLLINEQPPDSYNVFYAGWSAIDTPADSVIAVHHPSGDIKKISFDYDQITSTSYLGTSIPGDGSHWRIGQWEDGTTEPGSSGSPIYNRQGQVLGQLHGGYASCSSITSDWYGKFAKSWDYGGSPSTRIKDWLDPDNTGTVVLDGRDASGTSIEHTPLTDTRDSLNDYEVIADIISNVELVADSLLIFYQVSSVWYADTMVSTGNPDEYHGYIPAQSPGTVIDYYLYAVDIEGKADTTETYTFRIIDYGLTLNPPFDTSTGAVDDSVWYLMTVTNTGIFDDEFSLSYSGNNWTTSLFDETGTIVVSNTGTLLTDESFNFLVMVEVPTSNYGDYDSVKVSATSIGDNTYSESSVLITISDGEPFAIPFEDTFPSSTIDIGRWVLNATAEANDAGLNEPSPPYSLNLDGYPNGADTLMSQAIDLKNESNVIVGYFYQQTGGSDSPEANDDLFVEYLDSTGSWVLLNQHLGADADMTEYEEVKVNLGGAAYHSGFRLRFRNTGTAGLFDDWFIDDIFVGLPLAYEVKLTPTYQALYGPSGDSLSYLLTVHNKGLNDDQYDLSVNGNSWDVSFFDESGTTQIVNTGLVTASDSVTITVKVVIPGNAVMNDIDTATVVATSVSDAGVFASSMIVTSSAGAPGGFPWYEPFPDDSLNMIRWFSNAGADVSIQGIGTPSPPYSLNLDGGIDTVISQMIDLSNQSSIILSYYYQRGGGGESPDENDNLWVDYKNDQSQWININTHLGVDPVMTTFDYVNIGLPADAYHNGFQLRFHNFGSGTNLDDWFVDDIRVDFAPLISVTPQSFAHTLLPGDSTESNLVISNAGLGGLNFSINVAPVLKNSSRFAAMLLSGDVEPSRRRYPDGFNDYEDIKGSDDSRVGIPVEKDAGGPDGFGYFWIDSDEPAGPVFAWEDVSATGIDIVDDLNDDNYGGPYSLGFDFPYYGNTYNEIYVGSNGIIGFTSTGMNSRFKTSIPSSSTPNNILAWLWDDLNPDDADIPDVHVYIDTTGGRCVIQFYNYPEYGASTGDVVNAEVILESDGTITYQYLSIAAGFDAASCAVGIENADGTDGLEVAYLTSYLHDNLSIRFTAPYRWLTLDKSSGSLLTGESDTIVCKFTTGELDLGVYNANIVITNNDPNNNPTSVPSELTVSDTPPYLCGDVDGDSVGPDIADLVYFVDYMFGDPPGPPPPVFDAADVDNSGVLDIADLVYLVSYMFDEPSGPEPNCG